MLLILIIPPVIIAFDGTVDDPSAVLAGVSFEPSGAVLLIALAATGGILFGKLRIANPFFLGPLAFSAAAAALSLPVSAVPYVILAAAQVLLGVWLGAMFDRELLRNAGGFIIAALASTILLIVLCCAMALGVSAMTGIPWPTMVLATAPGSVTEMALTAKILQEGVAMVTAFHLVRIFIILPAAPLIFAITARLAKRHAMEPPRTPDN
jgi:membrane AbrB-like protein